MSPSRELLWIKVNTLPIPCSENSSFIFEEDKIIYSIHNVIKTWYWKTNTEEPYPINCEHISAFAKLKNGNFVVGDVQGWIYICNQMNIYHSIRIGVNELVIEILVAGQNYVIVKLSNHTQFLVDTERGKILKCYGGIIQVHVFQENFLALSIGHSVEIKEVTNLDKVPLFECVRDHCQIRVVNDYFLLLFNQVKNKKTLIIWDVLDDRIRECSWSNRSRTDQFEQLVFLDFDTFIVPFHKGPTIYLKKFIFKDRVWIEEDFISAGNYEVTCMKSINNYIIYGTRPKNSSIHLFKIDGTYVMSNEKIIDCGKEMAMEIIDLQNEFIAIKFHSSIIIVRLGINKKCRERLFIGEGDFSYTEALIKKHKYSHPRLLEAINSTNDAGPKTREENVRFNYLKSLNVRIGYGVSAEELNKNFSKADKIKRIHWNCPYGENVSEMTSGQFKDTFLDFFRACNMIQNTGYRVHVTLMQGKNHDFWQQIIGIVPAATINGYQLIKKRFFGPERYPGYKHTMTNGLDYQAEDGAKMREFVFEKNHSKKNNKAKKKVLVKADEDEEYYFECSTDYDSSDYFDSDEDNSSSINDDIVIAMRDFSI